MSKAKHKTKVQKLIVPPKVEKQELPQLARVAVLTITFLPPTNQIANIQPNFPAQMDAASVIHVLRRAEETLIGQIAQAQATNQPTT